MKLFLSIFLLLVFSFQQTPLEPSWDFDKQLEAYFSSETQALAETTRKELREISDWQSYSDVAREQLQEMLGLLPYPAKSPLRATVTGVVEHDEFTVEKVHFQSVPGLYLTGNLYIPKNVEGPMPAILYVCGHATVVKDGYNYGAKVHYQHHPAWFARHGYVCLILDTVQLGEIEGIHHGLYRYDRWWWMSRGYTPAGVEAWNGIRAIDYLSERPEVDVDRIGVTGRSGGGATTWWIAALDQRVKAAVPVAGITNMNDHVVEGCVEGHCDCMYIVNYHQWDYAKVAALVAPRHLLISNTDRDPIFPIDGVFDVFQSVRDVYQHLDVREALALHTTAGPHQDVQELRVHAFRWFNQHLHGHDDLIEKPAVKFFDPEALRVFDQLPTDAVNARIDESFVPLAPSVFEQLESASLPDLEGRYQEILRSQIFEFWPWEEEPMMEEVESSERDNTEVTLYQLKTDEHTKLPIFHIENSGQSADQESQVIVLDHTNWSAWAEYLDAFFPEHSLWKDLGLDHSQQDEVQELIDANGSIYLISARGMGPAQFQGNGNKLIHIKRRFYLLGQSLDAMQTWDLKQALEAITTVREDETVRASAHGIEAGKLLYATLFTTNQLQLFLRDLPFSHDQGPYYLGIMRHMDMPASVLMTAGKDEITISSSSTSDSEHWKSLKSVAGRYPDLSLNVADN